MDPKPEIGYEEVAQILKAIENSPIDELHLEIGGMILDVRRNGGVRSAPETPPVVPDSRLRVTAPMLGTFYRAPAPGAAPFVEIGSIVRAGDTLCIIEVMKLINTIVAPSDGRVVEIPVANAAIVEYGQDVIVLEPV